MAQRDLAALTITMRRRLSILFLSLLCSGTSIAFSINGVGNGRPKSMQATTKSEVISYEKLPNHLALAFMLVVSCPSAEPASAAPFNDFPLSQFAGVPTPSSKANNGLNLSDTDAFKKLPRQPSYSGAVKELRDLQDLQDSRLAACQDKGIYWEQCFMFGESTDGVDVSIAASEETRGRLDYQLISPVGSLNPPSNSKKIPTW